jgi:SAM-dependent methyltransferase
MGFEFPGDVQTISEAMLLTYLPGQPAPMKREAPLPQFAIATVQDAREIAASQLRGVGLEIGAYASPFPAPLECVVQYGDMYNYEELVANAYAGQASHDIVVPTVRTDLDTLSGVLDESLDFLIACHVIEHTRDPIGAIKKAYQKLRPGGSLVLIVPDKDKTFDRNRELTTLHHLIEDFCSPCRERDKIHFRDFYINAEGFAVEPEKFEETWRINWQNSLPIHYHTWTYESFKAMVEWAIENAARFESAWSHPTTPEGIEFYFTLTK